MVKIGPAIRPLACHRQAESQTHKPWLELNNKKKTESETKWKGEEEMLSTFQAFQAVSLCLCNSTRSLEQNHETISTKIRKQK